MDAVLLQKVFDYPHKLFGAEGPDSLTSQFYMKYRIHIDRKNPFLLMVPTMFYLARDQRRDFLGETVSSITYFKEDQKAPVLKNLLEYSTVHHSRKMPPVLTAYLQPSFYHVSLFKCSILSPLENSNRRFYRYRSVKYGVGQTRFLIRPKTRNTRLVSGWIIVDDDTGRIDCFSFEGEYDMIHFNLKGEMGEEGIRSLLPKQCEITAKVSVLGNQFHSWLTSVYDLKTPLPDTIRNPRDRKWMDRIRPLPLTGEERRIIAVDDSLCQNRGDSAAAGDSTGTNSGKDTCYIASPTKKQRNLTKYILWDLIGDNLLNRINADIGDNKQGHLRLGPIFNPLYFGYTRRKGIIYRFDVRGNYRFTPNRNLTARIKMGYAFKWRQLYYQIPFVFHFNERKNGWVKVEFANGNRIFNSRILEEIKAEKKDSIDWNKMNLDYFKDLSLQTSANYQVVKDKLDVQGGFIVHRRTAVDEKGFVKAGKPTSYRSVAPFIQLQLTPFSTTGPVITANYERGIKGFCKGDINYEKWEVDGQDIYELPCTRSLSLRGGVGLYTSRSKGDYFLDYGNFRADYISGGWNDEWSGEFELLNANWYNASDYYIRANATYETPLLFLSWMPLVGQVVEKERIYVSALSIRKLCPYMEAGYGFTNRVFSMGIFCGWSLQHFEGVGIKMGFELFNNW